MSGVRITVCVQGKDKLSLVMERGEAACSSPADERPGGGGYCPRLSQGEDPGTCGAAKVCLGVTSYFRDVLSVTRASVILANGKHAFAFNGSAQTVAAFAILAGFVASSCGRFSEHAFLLRRLCDPLGNGGQNILEWLVHRATPGLPGPGPAPGSPEWRDRFLNFVDNTVMPALRCSRKDGDRDTLPNARQILYVMAWCGTAAPER